MSQIQCDKCGNWSIEVIGDEELGCEVCLNNEFPTFCFLDKVLKEME